MDDGIQKPKVNPLIKRFLLILSYPTRYVASLWVRIGVGMFFEDSVSREAYDFCVTVITTDISDMFVDPVRWRFCRKGSCDLDVAV